VRLFRARGRIVDMYKRRRIAGGKGTAAAAARGKE
jgi:hypothetical protein